MKQGQVTVRVVDASQEDIFLPFEDLPILREVIMFRGDLLLSSGKLATHRLPRVKGYQFQWLHTNSGISAKGPIPEVVTVGYIRKEAKE